MTDFTADRRKIAAAIVVLLWVDAARGAGPFRPRALTLEIYLSPDHQPKVLSHEPDAQLIQETISDLPWDDLTFVVLKEDEDNGIELSGSLLPQDGLSARYWEAGKEFVSSRPPSSLDEGIALLQSYYRGDDQWRTLIRWQ